MVPRGYRETFKTFKPLYPGPWFKSCATPEEYRGRYWQILDALDPDFTARELYALGGTAKCVVLVCFEPAAIDDEKWCHRGLVSAWLHETLGLKVPELGFETLGHGWQHPKLHSTLKRKDA